MHYDLKYMYWGEVVIVVAVAVAVAIVVATVTTTNNRCVAEMLLYKQRQSPNTIRIIKSRWVSWTEHVTYTRWKRNTCKILVRKYVSLRHSQGDSTQIVLN
jgi:hypothetical protein